MTITDEDGDPITAEDGEVLWANLPNATGAKALGRSGGALV